MASEFVSHDDHVGRRATDVAVLVKRLAVAEQMIRQLIGLDVDAVIHPEGYAYLLRDAQLALLKSQDELQASETKYRELFEQAPEAIFILDPETSRVLEVNARATAITGYQVGDLTESLEDHFASAFSFSREEWRNRFARAMVGQPQVFELQVTRKDGTLSWLEFHLQRTVIASRVRALAFARPIDDRKRAEELEMALVMSDRMASMGALAAGIAHEVNNPLASVVVNLDLAAQEVGRLAPNGAVPPQLLEELGDARQAAERVRLIARDLRVFSRVEEDKLGPVDIERVLDSTLRMAWNEIRHRARLVKQYGHPPAVEAVEPRLGQVFLNLIVNAAQAIREGDYENNAITITTAVDDQKRVVVVIGDSGEGMSLETQQRVFTPFFTTKPAGVGTGLGLALCKRIVTSFAGELSFRSTLGEGTEFVLRLPASERRDQAGSDQSRPSVPAARRGRVLIIDDDKMFIRAVERVLGPEHAVSSSVGATPALELLRQGERFDVILCDVMMPQMTGTDLFLELSRDYPEQATRVIFISGGPFTMSSRDFFEAVENVRLEKPVNPRELRALINAMVQ